MKRRQKRGTGLAVSLFPFLAVLICTMGVLIVMLVLAVQSSAVKAQQAKREHTDHVQGERELLIEELDLEQFRVEAISRMRPQIQQRLERERLLRSHLDNEIRQLVEQARTLSQQFQKLQWDDSLAGETQADESDKIAELQAKIATRRKELQELRESVAGQPVLYSIVPTRSADGTGRRPIYLECTPRGIELQPSGIRIGLEDFTQPILPGNPLDVALLATREYWNRFDAGSSAGEPYPLIVVRPGGATAYALARRAMSSWDDEFGYELVESDKQLNWGEVDPNLSKNLREAIAIARRRQSQQVAAGRASWLDSGSGSLDGGLGQGQPLSNGNENRSAESAGSATAGDQAGSLRRAGSALPAGSDPENTSFWGQIANPSESSTASRSRTPGIDTSKPDSLSRFARQGRQSAAAKPARETVGAVDSAMKAATQAASAGEGNAASPLPSSAPSAAESLAGQRGANWALPTRTPGATPYRRPIRVDCQEDHYLVHSGVPDRAAVRVEIDEEVNIAIDELVNQVWYQIESWGMAEIGGYWKPVLRLTTNDIQGAARADELARKLQSSGIEIERQWR